MFFSFIVLNIIFPWNLYANVTFQSLKHSHNDYQQRHPLHDALDHEFDSVEADIWVVNNQIVVSHLGAQIKGTLKDLYLDPLQKRVMEKQSIFDKMKPFYLWLDIKDDNPDLPSLLHNLLSQYPMLTLFTDEKTIEGPVTVILTGNDASKISYVTQFPIRRACRDSNIFKLYDPIADQRWLWYTLQWSSFSQWGGYSKMRKLDKDRLKALVEYIHKKGRKVRFWDTPENEKFWKLANSIRIDLISSDRLEKFNNFTKSRGK